MLDSRTEARLREWAEKYNDAKYFQEDPIAFPRHFVEKMANGGACMQDVEIAAVISAHLAWGRRAMIVRDSTRALDEMCWRPYDYVMNGEYRSDATSLHRTVKWSEFAEICTRLRHFYSENPSLEVLSVAELRCLIFGSKPDRNAANKKINMMRRWMVRRDGKVDFGLWKASDPADLLIPLDVHVSRQAIELGLTARHQADIKTVNEITSALASVFPGDPCLGDFALFGYGVTKP